MAIQQIQHGHGATIYPSDTESISDYLQVYGRSTCLYIGTGGNLRVLTVGGDDVTFRNVQSGQFLPVMVTKVFLTGTTASNITVVDMGPGRFRGLLFDYSKRVSFDGGVVEAGACVDAVNNLLLNASLLLIPSGFKGGKLYSEIPTNGNGDLTWTRGSDAFRTNASGVIQRVPWNLVQYSEQFDNAYWIKSGSSVTANTTTAPNGTLTADSVVENNANSSHLLYVGTSSAVSAGAYTFSVYMKKNTRTYGFVQIATDTATKRYTIVVDLNSGSVTNTTSVGSPVNPSNIITNVGDGWYRISVTATNTSGSLFVIGGISDSATPTYTATAEPTYLGNGTSGLFIWGAQLVEGTTAQTYLPTTDRLNFPRLSYMYGSCPSVLLEPQRTNLALYSSAVGGTGWTMTFLGVGVTPTVTTNYAVAPDGTTSASRLQLSLGGGTTTLDQSIVTQTLIGTSCRGSFYIKTNDGSTKTIYVRGNIGYSIVIDGTWKRYDFDAGTLSTTQFGIGLRGGQTPTNSNTADILVWGAQLEPNAAYPTTYIPTTGSATATRVADSFSRNNIYTNGLISASGGTWFVELRNNTPYTADTNIGGIFLDDFSAGYNNGLMLRKFTTDRIRILKTTAGVQGVLYLTTTDTTKLAIKWNGTTCDVFANGTKVVSASPFTVTNMQFLGNSTIPLMAFIQQMALFPTPLSDTDCQLLTAL